MKTMPLIDWFGARFGWQAGLFFLVAHFAGMVPVVVLSHFVLPREAL